MDRYSHICEQRSLQGYSHERNDCTVVALSAVTGHTYDSAHMVLSYHSREPGCGWRMRDPDNARKVLGFYGLDLEEVDRYDIEETKGSRLTPASVGRYLPRGRYLIFIRRHVLALIDGEVLDWSAGRRHRIHKVFKITERTTT